jgi:hypothetical protein
MLAVDEIRLELCEECKRPMDPWDRHREPSGRTTHKSCRPEERRARPRGQFRGVYPNWNRELRFRDSVDGSK